ncbi:hypothetical protein SEVIR_4G178426v4 [Setaria viridis]
MGGSPKHKGFPRGGARCDWNNPASSSVEDLGASSSSDLIFLWRVKVGAGIRFLCRDVEGRLNNLRQSGNLFQRCQGGGTSGGLRIRIPLGDWNMNDTVAFGTLLLAVLLIFITY